VKDDIFLLTPSFLSSVLIESGIDGGRKEPGFAQFAVNLHFIGAMDIQPVPIFIFNDNGNRAAGVAEKVFFRPQFAYQMPLQRDGIAVSLGSQPAYGRYGGVNRFFRRRPRPAGGPRAPPRAGPGGIYFWQSVCRKSAQAIINNRG